jgi:hypothetical protein
VNNRFGESGMSELDGTMVCCFDLKKSRNDWRICVLVIIFETGEKFSEIIWRGRAELFSPAFVIDLTVLAP